MKKPEPKNTKCKKCGNICPDKKENYNEDENGMLSCKKCGSKEFEEAGNERE